MDPNSTAAREMVDEIAERVLRDLAPEQASRFFPDLPFTKAKATEA